MMKFYKLLISRNGSVKDSREIAVLALNLRNHAFGELSMVRYYVDKEKTEIDTVVAIGIKNGVGPDCYKIITLGGGNIITGILTEAPDISSLVHGEIYIYLDPEQEGKPVYVYEVNGERFFEEITGGPYKYEVVEDGYRWYFVNGVLKREDDFYSKAELDKIIGDLNSEILEDIRKIKEQLKTHNDWLIELDKEVFPLSMSVTNKTGTLFLTGTSQDVKLVVKVERKGEDITKECTHKLGGESITLDGENSYTKTGLTETTTLTVESTYTKLGLSKTGSSTVNFGYYYYYGTVPANDWEAGEETIKALTKKLSTKGTQNLTFDIDQTNKIVFCCPKLYGVILSIKDQNNLEYIGDYSDPVTVSVEGVDYYVYIKKTVATYKGFKQIFKYTKD